MQPVVLLDVFRGLLTLLVGGWFLAFRPLDRRVSTFGITCLLLGLDPLVAQSFGASAAYNELTIVFWLRLTAMVAFLSFAFVFPSRLRWTSLAGLAWILAVLVCIAQAVDLAFGSRPPFAELRLLDRFLVPGATGTALSMLLVTLGRLVDLRRPGVSDQDRRAGPYLLLIVVAGIFTGGGFEAGHLAGGLMGLDGPSVGPLGQTDFPSFFYKTPYAGWGYFLVALTGWWLVTGLSIAYAATRLRCWLPGWLMLAGFVSYVPILIDPTLPTTVFGTLRTWGQIVAPALAMYAQAKWAPFPGEPTRVSTGWATAAFAGLFAYAFAFVATLAVVPGSIGAIAAPIVGLVAGAGTAIMVLPGARKLQLQRLFALAAQDTFSPGAMVLGRYRITGLLAQGAQGRVYEAEDRKQGGARVVLKALTGEAAIREAHLLKDLDHPNIIRFVDLLEVPGFTLLVLEFAEGGTLRGLLARKDGRLSADEAEHLVDGFLSGLAEAHAHGVVHRDVKPENILLASGVPKLADFGVARKAAPNATLVPNQGGTLAYLAPEQVRGELGDARADVYAAGVVVHEVLTGQAPIDLPADDFLARQAILGKAPALRLAPRDKAIAPVLLQALAKDPSQRFRDAVEFRARIQAARSA